MSFREQAKLAFPQYPVLMHEPGLQGVTTVIDLRGEASLFVNHHGMTVKVSDTKNMADLPMLLHDDPQVALVICFGMGTTYRSALSHGRGSVTVVELVGGDVDAFPFFDKDAAQVLANPKGRIGVTDGRHFLKSTRQQFDIITIDPPPPIDGEGVNHLYSRDFIELARSKLKPGGAFAHWIPYPGTQAGVDDQQTFQMLIATVHAVFPHVYALKGMNKIGLHVVGSDVPLDASESSIVRRLGERPGVLVDMNELDSQPTSFFAGGTSLTTVPAGALILTDDRPYPEFYLLRNISNAAPKVLSGHLWRR
jgi:hypothetical protein